MAFYDGKGNSISVSHVSRLNGADVIIFGDSNVYYSAGNTTADTGSWYEQLAKEFAINKWVNKGSPGKNSYQAFGEYFEVWATDENVAKYNKESTFILFWFGTNDTLDMWQGEYQGTLATVKSFESLARISKLIEEKFPKACYAWFIPPATDWSKWTGSSEPDERNMAEKVPLMIQHLEKWNFPYCDMYHQSGITTSMLSDGIHLGGGGYDYTTQATYRAYRAIREYLMNK